MQDSQVSEGFGESFPSRKEGMTWRAGLRLPEDKDAVRERVVRHLLGLGYRLEQDQGRLTFTRRGSLLRLIACDPSSWRCRIELQLWPVGRGTEAEVTFWVETAIQGAVIEPEKACWRSQVASLAAALQGKCHPPLSRRKAWCATLRGIPAHFYDLDLLPVRSAAARVQAGVLMGVISAFLTSRDALYRGMGWQKHLLVGASYGLFWWLVESAEVRWGAARPYRRVRGTLMLLGMLFMAIGGLWLLGGWLLALVRTGRG